MRIFKLHRRFVIVVFCILVFSLWAYWCFSKEKMHRYWKSGFQDGLLGHARIEIVFNDDGTLQLIFALHDDKFKVYSWYEVTGTWNEKNDIIYTTIEAVGEVVRDIYYLKNNCLISKPKDSKEKTSILRPVSLNDLFQKEMNRDTERILPKE